jgi:hypothetical protein
MRLSPHLLCTALAIGSPACVINISSGPPSQDETAGTNGTSESTAPTTGQGALPSTGDDASTDVLTAGPQTSTTSVGGESTAAYPPECGNGIVEGEEQCDAGFMENGDDQACTTLCEKARCGDGHVQAVNDEACDDGPLNVPDPAYEQCSAACLRGPHCGDGVVQPEHEQCEAENQRGELENCAVTCTFQPRFVFLTSQAFTGDLDGIDGADQRCNELAADSPALAGTFRAWLLVDGQSLADRFPEFAGVKLSWNFTNTGGDVLAKSFDELVALGPASPIVYTEQGDAMPKKYVWTGITSDGQAAGGDCTQWTSVDGAAALVGHSGFFPDVGPDAQQWHAERRWTDRGGVKYPCKEAFQHLYCVQVAD